MKKVVFLSFLMLVLLLFSAVSLCENEEIIINLIDNPNAEYAFENDQILEVIFPRIYSSDCAILRFGEETMIVDSSTNSPDMQDRIRAAVELCGIDHFDAAYNSHPHRDHIQGFEFIHQYAPISKFLITFPDDHNVHMRRAVRIMKQNNVTIEQIGNQTKLNMGGNQEVRIEVIQHLGYRSWPDNDKSSMLHVTYGDRTILLTGDNEDRSQKYFALNPPHVSLKADILKYPHHGQATLLNGFREAIQPKLMYMNCASNVLNDNRSCFDELGIPYLIGFNGITRMRTDGKIWVVDYIEEEPLIQQ